MFDKRWEKGYRYVALKCDMTDCFPFNASGAHAADHDAVLPSSQIQTRLQTGLLWLNWMRLYGWWGLQGGWDFAEYLRSVNLHVFGHVVSLCDYDRCGCWRWTVTRLSTPTVKCWRRWYRAPWRRHWVSPHDYQNTKLNTTTTCQKPLIISLHARQSLSSLYHTCNSTHVRHHPTCVLTCCHFFAL